MNKIVELFNRWRDYFQPPQNSTIRITKDAKGQWWWLGIYTNKYEDRDREILSAAAHEEYIQWLRKTGFQPNLTAYHLPDMPEGFWEGVWAYYGEDIEALQKIVDTVHEPFSLGKVYRVSYLNGFMVLAAKFHPERAEAAEKLSRRKDVGMSHGFMPLEISDRIYEKYRTFEMSVLRNKRAANVLTMGTAQRTKDGIMSKFTKEDREFLLELFNEDAISSLENGTAADQKILDEILVHKHAKDESVKTEKTETKTEPETPVVPEVPATEPTPEPVVAQEKSAEVTTADLLTAINKTFVDLQGVLVEMQQKQEASDKEIASLKAQLTEGQTELKEKVEKLEANEDDKIAALITPVNFRAGYSASQDSRNVVKSEEEHDELLKDSPVGTQPKEPTFLDVAFWQKIAPAMNNGGS